MFENFRSINLIVKSSNVAEETWNAFAGVDGV